MGLTPEQAAALGLRVDPAPAPDGPFARAVHAKRQAEAEAAAAAGDTRTPEQREKAKRSATKAQAAGGKAEAQVKRACDYYRRSRQADVRKRNPGAVMGHDGRPRMAEKGAADFEGWLCAPPRGGRAVHVEVKNSDDASLDLRRRDGKPTVTREQRERLSAAHAGGCLAGVLVRIKVQRDGRFVRRWFWLRWPEYLAAERAAKADGAKSISQDLLERHGVECDTRRLHGAPDWLVAALEADAVEAAA